MDSFFSLFDPSDSVQNKPRKQRHKPDQSQDTAKKKPDQSKGRRRKKNQSKHDTLPEESSFLCDPNLTTDLLVKDGSYIESFIAPKIEDNDSEKRSRRRNSTRRNRRRKKTSPGKEFGNENEEDRDVEKLELWNNKMQVPRNPDESIGKNVNDLNKFEINRKMRRKDWEDDGSGVGDEEKVSTPGDNHITGDWNGEDLEDCFYSSDDMDDSQDDSLSDFDDSSDECYGSLPPEPRFGNVEYKLQLVNPCERRFQHLVTQLKWRLRSGGGGAVYVVGVRDSGALRGLRARALRGSLATLRRMAAALRAELHRVTARRLAPHRAVAEVYVRKLADTQQSVELRVAVMGANEAGKSTLIGVLTQGELDNGRGAARLNMFRHLHEVRSGRTSSLSHEILGFDAQGNVVNYGCSELMTAERIGERSAKLVAFLDLAGHRKYQKTTVHGLTGYSPHYAMLVVSATAGINRMTEEHIGLLLALDLPFFIVVTKLDLAQNNLEQLLDRLKEIFDAAQCNKCPRLVADEHAARRCVAPRALLDALDGDRAADGAEAVPVFPVSCVRGGGLNSLHAYLLALEPRAADAGARPEDEACEFQIDEIFHVGAEAGPVVGGLLARGRLREGDRLLAGPLERGEFVECRVLTVHRNRVPCGAARAGHSASLGLAPRLRLRQGMVLLAIPEKYKARDYVKPSFGGCGGVCASTRNKMISEIVDGLSKNVHVADDNIYRSDSEDNGKEDMTPNDGEKPICSCSDEVLLEDPNDPRGCLFFQATVRLLRHSTAIYPGFQATVHIGNVRQTAVIEGIMSWSSVLRAGESASVVFRFARQPEFVRGGRRLLFRAGLDTHGVGTVTQVFPCRAR